MIYSRKITLALKLNPTMFQVVNQKSIGAFNTIFGPSIKAVLTLSSKTAEMASILPTIIGASADSRNVNILKTQLLKFPLKVMSLKLVGSFLLTILLNVMLFLIGLKRTVLILRLLRIN